MAAARTRNAKTRRWLQRDAIGTGLILAGLLLLAATVVILPLPLLVQFFAKHAPPAPLEVPPLTGRVVDLAQTLSPEDADAVDAEIRALEAHTGGQMAILLIPSLKGNPLEEYALKVAQAWQLGHAGADNGVLLLLSLEEHADRLEVGLGWEPQLTDAKAGDILRAMTPYLRADAVRDALLLAVRSVAEAIAGPTSLPSLPPPPNAPAQKTPLFAWILMILTGSAIGSLIAGGIILPDGPGSGRSRTSSSSGSSARSHSSSSRSSSSHSSGSHFSGGGGHFGGGGASGHW